MSNTPIRRTVVASAPLAVVGTVVAWVRAHVSGSHSICSHEGSASEAHTDDVGAAQEMHEECGVVGVPLEDLVVDVVAGSSLASGAFMHAVERLRAEVHG